MYTKIEDFKTGWYGLTIGLKDEQIDEMIAALESLRQSKGHFHFRSDYLGDGGVSDMEFHWVNNDSKDNMTMDDSPAIEPNR